MSAKKVPKNPRYKEVGKFSAALHFIADNMSRKELMRALKEVEYLEAHQNGPWLAFRIRAQIADLCMHRRSLMDKRRKQLPLL